MTSTPFRTLLAVTVLMLATAAVAKPKVELKQKANAEEDIAEFTSAIMDWMGTSDEAEAMVGNRRVLVKWPSRTYRAQPEKVTPAKPERTVRSKTLQIKELD